jgi:chromate transporter
MKAPNRPTSRSDLFWSFSWLALQGFGGVVAVVQREMVEKKQWLTREEFVEEWAVAQILPGPNVVNLSLMIGDRYFGIPGALAALAGMLTFPLMIVLTVVIAFSGVSDLAPVQGALRGMGAVSAGLITATGLKLLSAVRQNPLGVRVCWLFAAASFVAIGVLRWPLAWVLFGIGGVACVLAYRAIVRVHQRDANGGSP